MKWHIEKKSLIHYSLKKGCKLMHPFLLSVFISCIYFELIFKMKSVDNTSANPRISIAGNVVPKKIARPRLLPLPAPRLIIILHIHFLRILPLPDTDRTVRLFPRLRLSGILQSQSYPDVPQFSTVLRIPPARIRRSASPMRILTRPDIS